MKNHINNILIVILIYFINGSQAQVVATTTQPRVLNVPPIYFLYAVGIIVLILLYLCYALSIYYAYVTYYSINTGDYPFNGDCGIRPNGGCCDRDDFDFDFDFDDWSWIWEWIPDYPFEDDPFGILSRGGGAIPRGRGGRGSSMSRGPGMSRSSGMSRGSGMSREQIISRLQSMGKGGSNMNTLIKNGSSRGANNPLMKKSLMDNQLNQRGILGGPRTRSNTSNGRNSGTTNIFGSKVITKKDMNDREDLNKARNLESKVTNLQEQLLNLTNNNDNNNNINNNNFNNASQNAFNKNNNTQQSLI